MWVIGRGIRKRRHPGLSVENGTREMCDGYAIMRINNPIMKTPSAMNMHYALSCGVYHIPR